MVASIDGTAEATVVVTRAGSAAAAIPAWVRAYQPRPLQASELTSLDGLPDVTVVMASGMRSLLGQAPFLETLAELQEHTGRVTKILFAFRGGGTPPTTERMSEVLGYFSAPNEVEFGFGAEHASLAFQEALAKLSVVSERLQIGARPADPIGELEAVLAATAELRAPSGRLSARKTAERFGLSVAELARLLGSSRQAVSKTEDAESLQTGLEPFSRVARLRAVLSDDDFRAWLNLPNAQIEGRTPIEAVRSGEVPLIAELVDDMLSGQPG